MVGAYVRRSRKGDKVEQPEHDFRVRQFEPTVLEPLTAEDGACLTERVETISGAFQRTRR